MRSFLPPPIWLHLTLTILVTVAGFFGGFLAGIYLFFRILSLIDPVAGAAGPMLFLAAALFSGGAFGGRWAAEALMRRVPAPCPKCGGRAYRQAGSPSKYYCIKGVSRSLAQAIYLRTGGPSKYCCRGCPHVQWVWW